MPPNMKIRFAEWHEDLQEKARMPLLSPYTSDELSQLYFASNFSRGTRKAFYV